MGFSAREFRDALALFATGVAIVTTIGRDGTRLGKTISSFNAVSLEPPLILFSIARAVQTLHVWQSAGTYTVSLLNENQGATATRFAGPNADNWCFASEPGEEAERMRISEALACFQCEQYAQYDGGDHVIFVGLVRTFRVAAKSLPRPLLFFCRKFEQLDATAIQLSIEADMWLHGW